MTLLEYKEKAESILASRPDSAHHILIAASCINGYHVAIELGGCDTDLWSVWRLRVERHRQMDMFAGWGEEE
ncbi:MAG TPA: hypothetical protein PK047_06945 [Saprospiraceae bacterium]|jgi:hypothetical protein|nr:hypothetical protein [Saprospiraceae bacterium]HRP41974.1 hypothetical protein [Saprospiraceae bacterium]